MSSIESAAISVCDRVGAGACRFDHHVEQVVDDVGVVAGEADHRVGIEAAIEDVVVAGAGAADQQVVARAADRARCRRCRRRSGRCRCRR